MGNGVSNLTVLLQNKQTYFDKVSGQKTTDKANLDTATQKADNAQKDVEMQNKTTSELIERYENHPFKGMKMPEKPNEAKYEIVNEDGSKGVDKKEYAKAMDEFNKDMAEYEKAEKEYGKLEEDVKNAKTQLEKAETELDTSNKDVDNKDKTLQATTEEYDKTAGEVEDLKKQVAEEEKNDKIEVKLTNDKDNNTLVKATVNQMKALQAKGLIDKDLDLNSLSKGQLMKISEAVVSKDINNGTAKAGTKLDGTSSNYTNMKAGDSRTYSVSDLQNIAKTIGGKETKTLADMTKDLPKVAETPSLFNVSAEELDKMNAELNEKDIPVMYKAEKAPVANQAPVYFNGTNDSNKALTMQEGEKAPVANQAPVYFNGADDSSKALTMQEGEKAPVANQTPVYADENVANDSTVKDKTSTSRKSLFDSSLDDMLKDRGLDDIFGKGFEDFNSKTYAKITANFKDGAKGMYDINGTRFAATQKISESGEKAYLINGEYYALRSEGMPDLDKKLNKADFEK